VSSTGSLVISPAELLPQLVERHARQRGDKVFLAQAEGGSQTYAQTHERALGWARSLASIGVKPGEQVARFTPTCMESVNIWVGLGWLHATDVPINTDYRGSMLTAILQNAQAKVLILAARWVDLLLEVAAELTCLQTVILLDGDTGCAARLTGQTALRVLLADDLLAAATAGGEPELTGPELTGPEPHELAMVVYTSGTAGVSKAAMLPWAMYASGGDHLSPPDGELSAADVLYLPYPLFHIAGTFWTCAIARAGATVILREAFSTSAFWSEVRRHGCTMAHLLGATANFISRQPERPDDAANPLRIVSMIPMLKELDAFEKRFGVRAFSVYGMTELGVVTRTALSPADPASCGAPFDEFELRIVDELDREVPVGEVGELVVRSTVPWTTTAGYFGMPQATVEAWRNLWFHTGDGFRRDTAGNYYFVDRIKDTIRRRGENISSVEVEQYVLRHEAVFECAAVPVPSELSEDEVKVCVVAKAGRQLDERGLIEFLLSERMPRFMVPRFVEILPELPRTPTGKIQKHALRTLSGPPAVWDRQAHMTETTRRDAQR
jgi:crotonobetaine/carnitine-CoA ligase